MDYKKSKAPVNTVTRNIMDLCEDTGNIYESVAIISKRANQISLQIKDDLSRLRFHVITRSCQSPHCWLLRSSLRIRFTGVIRLVTLKP